MRVQLRDLCSVRSGDKGDVSDLALFAYDDATYQLIVQEVTADRVCAHFANLIAGDVVRYEVPRLLALKFVLGRALAGGNSQSLRSDNMGKAFGGALLRLEIDRPDDTLFVPRPRVDLHRFQWPKDLPDSVAVRTRFGLGT
jgi:hypothetical protein